MPRGLAATGSRLWRDVVAIYDLRTDELLLLDKAARTADDLARLEQALAGEPLTTVGSAGQLRAHPLLAELRGMRLVLGSLLRQLALPDPNAEQDAPRRAAERSDLAMRAARARWDRPRDRPRAGRGSA